MIKYVIENNSHESLEVSSASEYGKGSVQITVVSNAVEFGVTVTFNQEELTELIEAIEKARRVG